MCLRVSHNDRTLIILESAGENLRRRRAEAINQNNNRSLIDHTRILVCLYGQPIAFLDLYRGAHPDEQTHHLLRLGQRSAAVAAQVQQDPLHALQPHIQEDIPYVISRTLVSRFACRSRTHVGVESRQ